MSYSCYLCLYAHSGFQHILCWGFALLVFVLLPVSLDCPFWIAPSLTFIYIVECRVLTVEMIANTYQCKVLKTFKTKQYTVIIYISQK